MRNSCPGHTRLASPDFDHTRFVSNRQFSPTLQPATQGGGLVGGDVRRRNRGRRRVHETERSAVQFFLRRTPQVVSYNSGPVTATPHVVSYKARFGFGSFQVFMLSPFNLRFRFMSTANSTGALPVPPAPWYSPCGKCTVAQRAPQAPIFKNLYGASSR